MAAYARRMQRPPARARPVRVATFNLHHAAPPHRWARRRALAEAVRRVGADLVALQEVDRRVLRSGFADQASVAARAAGLHPTFVRTRRLGPGSAYGIAVLSAARPTAVETVWLPRHGGEQRAAVLLSTELGGERVSVAATHLQNDPDIAPRQLEVVLDRLLRRPGPRLLLGDLNVGPAAISATLSAAGFSWPAAPPTFPVWNPRSRIDWIAAEGRTLDDAVVPDVWLSDHFPLVATWSEDLGQ